MQYHRNNFAEMLGFKEFFFLLTYSITLYSNIVAIYEKTLGTEARTLIERNKLYEL